MTAQKFRTRPHLWLIGLVGVIVPRRMRVDWRQEWEAELNYREALLAEWDRLDWRGKFDLLWRSASAFWDALWLQQLRWEDEMIQDLRYGARMLVKRPGLTVVVVMSLALGIGANTTIFSFVNALLLRPPAVTAPGQLVEIWHQKRNAPDAFERYIPLNYSDYAYYRENNRIFSELLAYDGDPTFASWSQVGQAEMTQGQIVSGNFFSTLGVNPAMGRTFLPQEDQAPGQDPAVVLSYAFWRDRLGSDLNILGKTLTLNGHDFTVIGVTPAGFTGMIAGLAPDFWITIMMAPQIKHDPDLLTRRGTDWLLLVGRIKPGVNISTALADMNLLAGQLRQAYPQYNQGLDTALFPATMVPGPFRGFVGAFTGVLMAVVGLVLLIACANAANLLLAQAMSRRQEMAIRAALGAKRGRLVRQSLTESILLACMGGGGGLAIAYCVVPVVMRLKPASLPIRLDVPLDFRVLAFTLFASVLTGIIFGLAPAWRSTTLDLTPVLKDASYGRGYHRSRFRNALIIGQVALCVMLLIAGGLCLRSLHNAQSVDIGFETQGRFAASFNLTNLDYTEAKGRTFYKNLIEEVQNLSGVQSASIASYLPLQISSSMSTVNVEGHEPPAGEDGFSINTIDVGPDYFHTMGTPVLRGREFDQHDDQGTTKVVIINEAMARRFWPGKDPVGSQLTLGKQTDGQRYEVIGIVKTGKYRTLSEDPRPFFYRSFFQVYHPAATLVVRTGGEPRQLFSAVRGQVYKRDPHLALIGIGTLGDLLTLALFPAKVTGILLGVFGLLGLGLALVGLSGAIAYSVSQRTREIGVRMALGAQPWEVLRLVLRQGIRLTLCGLSIGILASLALTRLLANLLYSVSATDPMTFVGVSLLLITVSLLACYFPARRAAKVDPMVALRYE